MISSFFLKDMLHSWNHLFDIGSVLSEKPVNRCAPHRRVVVPHIGVSLCPTPMNRCAPHRFS